MSLYGYENRQAELHRIVTIHTAGCGHCKDGKGNMEGNPIMGKWHGPFRSIKRAHHELHRLPGVAITRLHECVQTPKPAAVLNVNQDETAAMSRMDDDGGPSLPTSNLDVRPVASPLFTRK